MAGVVGYTNGPGGPGAAQAAEVPFLRDLADGARQAYGSGSYPGDRPSSGCGNWSSIALRRVRLRLVRLPDDARRAAVARAGWVENLDGHHGDPGVWRSPGLRRAVPQRGVRGHDGQRIPATQAHTGARVGLLVPGRADPGARLRGAGPPWFASYDIRLLARRLAAVGRMALTNYLLQSDRGLHLHGFGALRSGRTGRFFFALCTIAWAVNLVVSPHPGSRGSPTAPPSGSGGASPTARASRASGTLKIVALRRRSLCGAAPILQDAAPRSVGQ